MHRRQLLLPGAVLAVALCAGAPAVADDRTGPHYPDRSRADALSAATADRRDVISAVDSKAALVPDAKDSTEHAKPYGGIHALDVPTTVAEQADATAQGLGEMANSGTLSASTDQGTWHFDYGPGLWSPGYVAGERNSSWSPAGDRLAVTTGGTDNWTFTNTIKGVGGTSPVSYPGGEYPYRGLMWTSTGDSVVFKTQAPQGWAGLLRWFTSPSFSNGQLAGPVIGPPALHPLGGEGIARQELSASTSDLVTYDYPDTFVNEHLDFTSRRLNVDRYRPGDPALAQAPSEALGSMSPIDISAPTYLAFLGVDPEDATKGHLYVDHQDNWPTITPMSVATFTAHPECMLPAPAFSADRRTIAFATAEGDPSSNGGVCGRTALRTVTVGLSGRFDAADIVEALEWWSEVGKPYRTLSFRGEMPYVDPYRISGKNRYEVGINTSTAFFDDQSADVVVVSGGLAYADALAGGPLAGEFNGPVLLTYPTTLHSGVAAEIDRVLKPNGTVYITGGTASVSTDVERALTKPGRTVKRLGGANRYVVAVNIAKEMDSRRGGPPASAFVAGGTAFADALVAGPAAVLVSGPILLSGDGFLPAVTLSYLDAVDDAADFRTYGVGGAGSRSVASRPNYVEVSGANRYDVAREVAERFFPAESISALADGRNWPDAVSGGAAMSGFGMPIMLTNGMTLPKQTAGRITQSSSAVDMVLAFGGPASVPDEPLWLAADLAGMQTPLWGPHTAN